jgi:hypothetical protein
MQIGFPDLCIRSFLMASAHGAGFMLLPILLKMSTLHAEADLGDSPYLHVLSPSGSSTAPTALLAHPPGYLLVTGLIASVVYERLSLEVLRRTWVNLDLIWPLITTAGLTLIIPT